MANKADIRIYGQLGFYQIVPTTRRGESWMRRVDGFNGRVAFCDDTRMTQNIADGAVTDGLSVFVNDRRYSEAR